MQLHYFDDVECFDDYNKLVADTFWGTFLLSNFMLYNNVIVCYNGVVCLNGICATSFCTMCKGNLHLAF